MFDIGFSELFLVFIVGLVVLGPQRLPMAIRTVVGWIRTLRGLAANVQNELTQELKLQELQESIKKAEQLNLQTLSPELNKTVEELKESAKKMQAGLNKASGDFEAEIAEAKARVQYAVDTDMANAKAQSEMEQSAVPDSEISENPTALLKKKRPQTRDQEDDIMAQIAKYHAEDTVGQAPVNSQKNIES